MGKAILDTDILSEFLKGFDQNVVRKGLVYGQEHNKFTFTSVTVFEIMRGLEEKGAPAQAAKALAWFQRNEQLVPEADDYLTAARVIAQAKHQGKVIELPDSLIAAIASRLALPLVTGNTADFQVIKQTGLKLTLENWREL